MPTYRLMPVPRQQFFDNDGNPLSGGKVYFYTAGTSTLVDSYSDSSGTPNANPVILDSGGSATIYLDTAVTYKIKLTDSADVQLWIKDSVSLLADGTSATSATTATSATSATSATTATSATNLSGGGLTTASGKVTVYNSIACVGEGVPPIYKVVDLTAQTAAIGATNLYAAAPTGLYRFNASILTSALNTAALTAALRIDWTDSLGAQSLTFSNLDMQGANSVSASAVIKSVSPNNIQYRVTFTGSRDTGTYELHIALEKL